LVAKPLARALLNRSLFSASLDVPSLGLEPAWASYQLKFFNPISSENYKLKRHAVVTNRPPGWLFIDQSPDPEPVRFIEATSNDGLGSARVCEITGMTNTRKQRKAQNTSKGFLIVAFSKYSLDRNSLLYMEAKNR
jgi:hypothetical protein